MAPVLVCSGSLRMEADRAKLIKGVTMRNKPDPPPPPTLSSWWRCSWESPSKTPPWLQYSRPHPMAFPFNTRTQDLWIRSPTRYAPAQEPRIFGPRNLFNQHKVGQGETLLENKNKKGHRSKKGWRASKTRRQTWCTTELHRDPISKMLLER